MSRLVGRVFLTLALVGFYAGNFGIAVGGTHSSQQPATHDLLKQGDAVGVFYVTKVAGAEDDGVASGQTLCYRCRYGSSPIVMVFARQTGGQFPELVRQLDAAVSKHQESRLKGLVTLMGKNAVEVKAEATRIAIDTNVTNIPVAIASELNTGPLNYNLPRKAAVTIIVAKDSQVVSTYTFTAEKVDVAAVMRDVKRIVN